MCVDHQQGGSVRSRGEDQCAVVSQYGGAVVRVQTHPQQAVSGGEWRGSKHTRGAILTQRSELC